jgi:hypothetical protein
MNLPIIPMWCWQVSGLIALVGGIAGLAMVGFFMRASNTTPSELPEDIDA